MYQSKPKDQKDRYGFSIVLVLSALVHLFVIGSLPDADESTQNTYKARVEARLVAPPKPKPEKKVVKVEKVKPPEKKVEPKKEIKKEEPKKVAKKPKVKRKRKKRRPPRSLTVKRKGPAPAAAPSAQPIVVNAGKAKVTDLGDWDPDATDDEVNRDFDPDATDDDEPEVIAEPEKEDIPKDRKARCKVKKSYPAGATAVLPARVVFSVKISAIGRVENVKVVRRTGDLVLDNEARKAVLSAKCRPAIRNGKRVASLIPFTVEYK